MSKKQEQNLSEVVLQGFHPNQVYDSAQIVSGEDKANASARLMNFFVIM